MVCPECRKRMLLTIALANITYRAEVLIAYSTIYHPELGSQVFRFHSVVWRFLLEYSSTRLSPIFTRFFTIFLDGRLASAIFILAFSSIGNSFRISPQEFTTWYLMRWQRSTQNKQLAKEVCFLDRLQPIGNRWTQAQKDIRAQSLKGQIRARNEKDLSNVRDSCWKPASAQKCWRPKQKKTSLKHHQPALKPLTWHNGPCQIIALNLGLFWIPREVT